MSSTPSEAGETVASPMFEGMTAEKLRTLADWFDTYDAIIEQVIFTVDGEDATDGKALIAVRGKEVQDDLRRWAADIERWTAAHPRRPCDHWPDEVCHHCAPRSGSSPKEASDG